MEKAPGNPAHSTDPPAVGAGLASARLGMPLEEQLVAAGIITQTQLDLATRELRRRGGTLRQILVDLRFTTADVLSEFIARGARSKVVRLRGLTIDRSVLEVVPYALARRLCAVPVSCEGSVLTVALADPLNVIAIDTLQQATGLHINVVTATERDILTSLDRHYAHGNAIEDLVERIIDTESDEVEARPAAPVQAADLRAEDAPVIQLVSEIITRAVRNGASDIHFEPEEKNMRIRSRIDGFLFAEIQVPKSMQSLLTTRMKILGDMDVAETRLPQDGRATVTVDRRQVNLRISSLPNRYGENIVVRMLDTEETVLELSALGFSPQDRQRFEALLRSPYGVIVITGPTGSGKSTTQYAALKQVDTKRLSVFTLEDPVEYMISGISQTQIHEEIGLTFSRCLRTLLRQDPDIILVGETRDTETAQLMVRAALTGHLVLSTLHTNDAAGAIPRLVDMGVEPFLLPAALLGVLAQRLVRTTCPQCKQPVPEAATVLESLNVSLPPGLEPRLWRGQGCPHCRESGYKGRLGIYELMVLDGRFHDPIVRRAGAPEYFQLAREKGMSTMFEDGLWKAVEGRTTLEEIIRVTRVVLG